MLALDQRGPQLILALLGHLTGQTVVVHGADQIAGVRHFAEADDLHRIGRTGALDPLALVVGHGADATIGRAGHDGVAHPQGAVLHQHRGHGAAALVQPGFDDDAAGLAVGVGLVILHLGHQQDHLQQLIHAFAGMGGYGHHDGVAAPVFSHQFVFGELLA